MNKLFRFSYLLLLAVITLTACVDKDFDNPPSEPNLPDITSNTTIAELKAKHIPGEIEDITEDIIIKGTVISDDLAGNFFRKIQIQDASGGIEISIDATDLHNDYPVGREVFIKCQGLTLGDFNNFIQIGLGTVQNGNFINIGRIPELVLNQYIVKGALGASPAGKVVNISDLSTDPFDENMGTLVTLENVEFTASSVGETYAITGASPQSVNHTLTDCDNNTILLRNSGFADFAAEIVPSGNGNITGMLGVFGNDLQLFIRDTTDVQFNNDPCLRGTGSGDIVTIASLRAAFAGGAGSVSPDSKIKGVIISERESGNFNGQNIVIQDATAGIVVRFTDPHNFDLGDEVEINVSSAELSEFNNLLQINGVSLSQAEVSAMGQDVTPQTITIEDLLDDFELLESSLVKIENVTLTGTGGTISGGVTVTDATGTIIMYTQPGASFSGTSIPTGNITSLTAVVSQFRDDEQLTIRGLDDIEGGMTGGGPTEEIDIADLRSMYNGNTTAAPADKRIKGIVISDGANENITGRNLVIQGDNGSGIVVRFTDNHSYELGDELEIDLAGAELSDFNGLVQVNDAPLSNATKTGTGTITPREITVADLLSQGAALESTLVKIVDVTISGSTTYSGGTTVSDATGDIPMFTRSQATFAGESLPGGMVNLTAIVSNFNGYQVNIRNLNDVD